MSYRIPNDLKDILNSYYIKEEDIKYIAMSDVSDDYRFADGYVILTKDKMVVAAYKPHGRKVPYSLGGYVNLPTDEDVYDSKPAVAIYELSEIEKLDTIREITGGVLVMHTKESQRLLVRFTNSKMGEFERLKGNLGKIKNNEELTEEDIKGKRKMECCPKCGTLYPDQERKICPKCMDRKSIFTRMLAYFFTYKVKLAIMFICFMGTAVLNLVWPYLSGTVLYDKVLSKDENFLKILGLPGGEFATALVLVVITMIVSKILLQFFGILHGVMNARIVPDVMAKLKQEIFNAMGKLSISFYNSRQTGGLMTRVLDDVGEVTGFFLDGLPFFFTNIFTIIVTAIIMISIHPVLAIASLCLMPFLTIVSYKMLPKLWSYYGRRHRAARKLSAQMNDNITGARVVKAFGQEEQELKRFGTANSRLRKAELDITSFDNKYYALYNIVQNVTAIVVWGLGAAIVLKTNKLEYGILVTFTGYVSQLNGPLDFLSYIFRWWTNSMNSAQRVFEIIDAVPEVAEKEDPVRPEYIAGEIELKNVTFGYEPHKPVLKDVSFKIEAGKMLGIVGRSGAGKSTLVNLISRLYDTESGEILIDGINVKDMGFKELRKNIAMVSQETYIFMGTVAENIAYARPDATRKEIIEAAMQASAHDFICKMPDGYDTIIGRAGRSLSGGERQRISIARAILSNPRILILDEATAAVDTETELSIQESLEKLVVGRTTLSIAHRLSTLRNADKLIVIDDGKVTEEGTHEELIELKGTFYKLMELQTKALAMRGLE